MKTKILLDFQMCISVPLTLLYRKIFSIFQLGYLVQAPFGTDTTIFSRFIKGCLIGLYSEFSFALHKMQEFNCISC